MSISKSQWSLHLPLRTGELGTDQAAFNITLIPRSYCLSWGEQLEYSLFDSLVQRAWWSKHIAAFAFYKNTDSNCSKYRDRKKGKMDIFPYITLWSNFILKSKHFFLNNAVSLVSVLRQEKVMISPPQSKIKCYFDAICIFNMNVTKWTISTNLSRRLPQPPKTNTVLSSCQPTDIQSHHTPT